MKLRAFSLCVFACTACAFDADEVLDRLDTALTLSAFQDSLRARLSGTLDLEFYNFEQAAPGLINSDQDNLFNPRLTLFLDTQLARNFISRRTGSTAGSTRDEALRFAWMNTRFELRPGGMGVLRCRLATATVVGNWVRGTCRGIIRLLMRRWFVKTSRRSGTNTLLFTARFHRRSLLLRKLHFQSGDLGTELCERLCGVRTPGRI
jgi:hypothetical protein